MLKKYISKFTIDILPSILATIVGAYIVNHYIVPKASPDRPAAAASAVPEGKTPEAKTVTGKPAETSSDMADAPDPAPAKLKNADKGSDKPVFDKASIDRSEKSEAASVPNRHQPTREKAVAKVTPAPVTPAAVAPALATVGTAPAIDGNADDRRDVNGLARAAIERLNRSEPRSQEAVRVPDAPRVQEAVRTVPGPTMQQLPPPIVVATPSIENPNIGSQSPYPQADRSDSRRMRPPGDIPKPLPIDLQASAATAPRPERTNVAEDVLSAAKSVFNSVIPHPFER